MNDKCKKCGCRECLDNAEFAADGGCRNCEVCRDNDFEYGVYSKDDCLDCNN